MAVTDYSERIPAAIAKAERLLDGRDGWFPQLPLSEPITAGEVALADALHKTYRALNAESGEEHWPDALIAFCTKIEGLSDD